MKRWTLLVLLPALVAATFGFGAIGLGASNPPARKAPAKQAPAPTPPPIPAPAVAEEPRDQGTLDITSDQDLELLQQDHAYVARGNAIAKRGAVTLMGDTIIAYYRPLAGTAAQPAAPAKPGETSQSGLDTGNTEIWRVVAEGNVHIFSGERDAFGDRAEYDKDNAVIVMTGKALKGSTLTDVVTARDSLEYWQDLELAVARGDALIVRVNGNTLAGDVVAGHFVKDAKGQDALKTITSKGNVVVTTLTDVVHGDEGAYDLDAQLSVVFGNVKATRGDSELEGQSAEVNMVTGISQVFPGPGERVHGLFVRESLAPSAPAAGSKPPAGAH